MEEKKCRKLLRRHHGQFLMVPKFTSLSAFIYYPLLSNKLDKQSSLYRDDGLYFKETHPSREQTEYEMDIIEIFKNAGFKIEIKTNLHIVNFWDVTFNLLDGTYKPNKKSNDQLLYINASSNHPPQIIKTTTNIY